MIGVCIEKLKNPKNSIPWIIAGWVFCGIGYLIFTHWRVEPLGQIFAVLGLAAILVTALRLSLTKIPYAVICAALAIGYLSFYAGKANWEKDTRVVQREDLDKEFQVEQWTPKYGSGTSQKIMAFVFAPAAMGNVILSSEKKGRSFTEDLRGKDIGKYSELGEGHRAHKERRRK